MRGKALPRFRGESEPEPPASKHEAVAVLIYARAWDFSLKSSSLLELRQQALSHLQPGIVTLTRPPAQHTLRPRSPLGNLFTPQVSATMSLPQRSAPRDLPLNFFPV